MPTKSKDQFEYWLSRQCENVPMANPLALWYADKLKAPVKRQTAGRVLYTPQTKKGVVTWKRLNQPGWQRCFSSLMAHYGYPALLPRQWLQACRGIYKEGRMHRWVANRSVVSGLSLLTLKQPMRIMETQGTPPTHCFSPSRSEAMSQPVSGLSTSYAMIWSGRECLSPTMPSLS